MGQIIFCQQRRHTTPNEITQQLLVQNNPFPDLCDPHLRACIERPEDGTLR